MFYIVNMRKCMEFALVYSSLKKQCTCTIKWCKYVCGLPCCRILITTKGPAELRAALAPVLPCSIGTSRFYLSYQNEYKLVKPLFLASLALAPLRAVGCSKEPEPFNGAKMLTLWRIVISLFDLHSLHRKPSSLQINWHWFSICMLKCIWPLLLLTNYKVTKSDRRGDTYILCFVFY